MRKCLLPLAAIFVAYVLPISPVIACDKKPEVAFGERPFDPKEPSGGMVEFVIVDGVPWKHTYWKSAMPGVVRQGLLPDCRVLIVGRKGLSFYVAIDDVEWKHPVYNSSMVLVSKDNRYIAHVGEQEVIINDEPQPIYGKVQTASFTEAGDLEIVWDNNGTMLRSVNGILVK